MTANKAGVVALDPSDAVEPKPKKTRAAKLELCPLSLKRSGKPCGKRPGHPGPCRGVASVEATRAAARASEATKRADPSYRKTPEYRNQQVRYTQKRRSFWREVTDAVKVTHGCNECGFQSDRPGYFDLDHVDRSDKLATLSRLAGSLTPSSEHDRKKFADELAKCQVLCVACHRDKTSGEFRASIEP